MKRMSTDPTKYVVFDVETNGLKSKECDLLSISIYKPDDGKEYNKFLYYFCRIYNEYCSRNFRNKLFDFKHIF